MVGGAVGVPVPVMVPPSELPGRVTLPPAQFTTDQKTALNDWLTKNLSVASGQECPPNMNVQGDYCVSARTRNWKLGSPLPVSPPAMDLPAKWAEILKLPPEGHRYVLMNEDILIVQTGTDVVVDQILEYGGIKTKKAQQVKQTSTTPPPSTPTTGTPTTGTPTTTTPPSSR
jgi:hypothetical protein